MICASSNASVSYTFVQFRLQLRPGRPQCYSHTFPRKLAKLLAYYCYTEVGHQRAKGGSSKVVNLTGLWTSCIQHTGSFACCSLFLAPVISALYTYSAIYAVRAQCTSSCIQMLQQVHSVQAGVDARGARGTEYVNEIDFCPLPSSGSCGQHVPRVVRYQ